MLGAIGISDFGGLDLTSSPDKAACVDQLNVDRSSPGVLKTRPGYTSLSSEPVGQTGAIFPYYDSNNTCQLVFWENSSDLRVINGSGTSLATETGPTASGVSCARIGTPTAEKLYLAGGGSGAAMTSWDGTSFTYLSALDVRPLHVTVQLPDNRLVACFQTDTVGSFDESFSSVNFSAEGDPETFDPEDRVELRPGDGEPITGACTWRELTFVFKQSWFAVFYGNSTDSTGGTIFNYRGVDIGSSAWPGHCRPVAGPDGVYFATKAGIYRTTGGPPVLVSRALDPLFRQSAGPMFQGDTLEIVTSLTAINDDLYVAYRTADNDYRMLRYSGVTGAWSYWQMAHPAQFITSFRDSTGNGGPDQLVTIDFGADGDVRLFDSDATDDDGTEITWRYRTGFSDLGQPGQEKNIAKTRLWGTGTVDVAGSRDFGALDTATAVDLGTSPAVDAALHDKQKKGELISYQFSGTGPASIYRYAHLMGPSNTPGARS